jgi:hypothetical protein
MRLPKEYRKYAVPGGYGKCSSAYGRKMLKKFGFGPELKVVEEVKSVKKSVSKKKTKTK